MNEEQIQSKYQELSQQLRDALATMEYSDKVIVIRDEIKELQNICPHVNKNYALNHKCPYCGKKIGE